MASQSESLRVEDDGLVFPEVGRWADTKYRLIALYDQLFSSGMKNKWGKRVYIDLYAGAGCSRIKDTDIRLKGSPMLALDVPNRFDKYIFCEEDPLLLNALRIRAGRVAPDAEISYVDGSCDQRVERIYSEIPRGSATNSVLSLCFVDPFDFGLNFETIRRLSKARIDFLVLLAVDMDANRAYEHYLDGKNPKIDIAIGNATWRDKWKSRPRGRDEFPGFIAEEFALSMRTLEYLKIGPADMKHVRGDKKQPLYYLALFSKHATAYKFWKDVLKYSDDQTTFGWE